MSVWKSDEKLLLFASLIFPSKIILLRRNIKHSTQCFITRYNTSKFVENTPLRAVFSTLFSVFHLVMKHCVSGQISYFNLHGRKIGSGTVNGPIVRRTHILEYSWGLRTRNPELSRRRPFQKFTSICGAGYHRFSFSSVKAL